MKKRGTLYIISNILYIGSVLACIVLWPNMMAAGLLGMLFIISFIIYSICLFAFYINKDNKRNNDFLQNLVSIFLYSYLMLIAYRYYNSINSTTYVIDIMYFKINYIISTISILAIVFNKFLNKYI